jgi:copper chaperone
METKTYRVDGMTCGGCVASLTRALRAALPGRHVEVTLEGGLVRVEEPHDAGTIEQAVDAAGFTYVGPS